MRSSMNRRGHVVDRCAWSELDPADGPLAGLVINSTVVMLIA
jgi:hypothetical protein